MKPTNIFATKKETPDVDTPGEITRYDQNNCEEGEDTTLKRDIQTR
jgi:hypothetical protein